MSEDIHSLSIEGMPGVGKSALAMVIAHHKEILSHFQDGVLWAGLGQEPDVMRALAIWGEALGHDVSDEVNEVERSQAVKDAIGQRRILLVIDDAWSLKAAEALRCGGPHCAHLLTTRDKEIARSFAGAEHVQRIPELEMDSSFDLLRALAPEVCEEFSDAALELAQAVGGLPLALGLIGGYLAAPESSYFSDLSETALADLVDPQTRLELAQKRLGALSDRKMTLQEVINLSLEVLPNEVQRAFYALGAFAPKPEHFDRSAAEAVSKAEIRVLSLLVARNLVEIDVGTERLALHQTLADVARMKMDTSSVTRHRDHYLALVNEDREDWHRIEVVYGQIRQAWKVVSDAGGEELLDLIWALQIFQKRRGLWSDYLMWAKRGLSYAKERSLQSEVGILLNNIGGIYHDLGQREKALEHYEQALPIWEEVGDRAGTAVTLNNIGGVYHNLGQLKKALEYYEQALPIMQEVGGRPGMAATLNNIGMVYHALGQREKALEYYEQALPIREEVGDRAGMAVTLNNIGGVYYALGQREKALEYYEQALPILEEVGDRAGESITRYNIAMILRNQGQLAEAVVELKRVVELDQLVQSPDLEKHKAMLAQDEKELAKQRDKRSTS